MGTSRCDCKQLSFVGLRSFARRHGITDIDELIRRTGCCTGCGTCRPHLEEFLRTGELKAGDRMIRIPEVDVESFSLAKLRPRRLPEQ
jgi:bacterioferritin-associated ferredoxin